MLSPSVRRLRIRFAFAESLKLAESNGLPDWVSVDTKKLEGTFKNVPAVHEICPDVNESLIVELYSR